MEEGYLTEGGRKRRIKEVKYYNEELKEKNRELVLGVCMIGTAAAISVTSALMGIKSENNLLYFSSGASGLLAGYWVKGVMETIATKAGIKNKIAGMEGELAKDDEMLEQSQGKTR